MKEIYSKTLADVTSKLPKPVSVSPETSIKDVLSLMVENDIGSVIIVNSDNFPVGIITERDLLIKVMGKGIDLENLIVGNIMTPDPYTLPLSKPVSTALVRMRVGKFRHIAITDNSGKLIKVFSIKDALNFLSDEISERMSNILTP